MKRRQSQALFSGVQRQDNKQGEQTETQDIPPDDQETLFSVKVTEHWYKLPWEAVGYPLLEIFRNHPDMVLGCLLYMALLEQGHWTR